MARVLVVENDTFLAAVLTDVLVEAGHRVEVVAGDACDVLEWLRAEWPDIIVLDLALPVVDGAANYLNWLETNLLQVPDSHPAE